jgi:hypothetical protein
LEDGEKVYSTLLEKGDSELEKGNLPRNEIRNCNKITYNY